MPIEPTKPEFSPKFQWEWEILAIDYYWQIWSRKLMNKYNANFGEFFLAHSVKFSKIFVEPSIK